MKSLLTQQVLTKKRKFTSLQLSARRLMKPVVTAARVCLKSVVAFLACIQPVLRRQATSMVSMKMSFAQFATRRSLALRLARASRAAMSSTRTASFSSCSTSGALSGSASLSCLAQVAKRKLSLRDYQNRLRKSLVTCMDSKKLLRLKL